MNTGWAQVLTTAQSSGAAVTAAAETTLLPSHAKYPMPAGLLANVGQQLWIRAAGIVSSAITTPGSIQLKVKFGSTAVFDGLAILLDTVAAHTNKPWWLDLIMTVTTVGSAATLMGHGQFTSENVKGQEVAMPVGSVVAMLPWNATPANGTAFDSTATQLVDLTYTQTVATGSVTLQQYALLLMN